MRLWLLATAMLGLTFLGGQVYEFTTFYREGLTLKTNLFGTTFYVLTGFHGAHVTVGILMLLSLFGLSFAGQAARGASALPVEMVGLYWHFVDIVWIVIFTVVYLIPTGNRGERGGVEETPWPTRSSTSAGARGPRGQRTRGQHPSPKEYIRIAIILAVITAARGRRSTTSRAFKDDPRPDPVRLLVRQVHRSSSCGSCT